jgi:hypothetical protein
VTTEEESEEEEDSEDTLLPLLLPPSEDNGGPKGELPHNAIGAGNTMVIRVACAGWYKGGAVGGDEMMDCEKVKEKNKNSGGSSEWHLSIPRGQK